MRRIIPIAWVVCLMLFVVHSAQAADAAKPSGDKGKAAKDVQPKKDAAAKKDQAGKKQAVKEKKQEAKLARLVRLTIKGNYPEGSTSAGIFGDLKPSLRTIIDRIDQAAEDTDVNALVLSIEDLEIGQGKIHELRAAIARFRKHGKPIYAELTSADTRQYVLAIACDEVFMPSSGMLILPGLRAEMTFYKGLFDKLGIHFDMLQEGKYKGAGEPFTRSAMSKPLRESMEALVDDSYCGVVNTIAKDRKLPDYQVKTLIDQGLFTAATAKKAGLIDRIAYFDEFQDSLKAKLKAKQIKLVTDYKKKQIDADFSGISGMVKLMELLFGGKGAEKSSEQQKIAVVYAAGVIVEGSGTSDMFGGEEGLGATKLIQSLRTADEDPKVVAIVLRIDSPGGSAVASDLIWREIVRIKKPVIASMSDVAGSGGYYIAMGARKIFAEPDTLTGSIGVIGGKMVIGGLLNKLGVSTEIIARGKNSGSLSMISSFTPAEREAWVAMLDETYHQFVSKAAVGRKMPFKKLEALAQGRVYTGRMAVANGLVDCIGTLSDAITEAKRAAHLKADTKVELLILPKAKSFFEQLFGDSNVSTEADSILPGLGGTIRQAALWRRVFSEPRLMLMPAQIELK